MRLTTPPDDVDSLKQLLQIWKTLPLQQGKRTISDFTWLISRILGANDESVNERRTQMTPGWTAFNVLTVNNEIRRSAVGYLPAIPSSPTQMSTVYQLLLRSLAVANELCQESVVIVLDQAIYCKAQEILWKHKEQFSRVVLRMGAFHTCLTFLATIGRRFGDAGLADFTTEAGVLGSTAAAAVISGKHYNRAVRAHKIVMEALYRVLWRKFETHVICSHEDGRATITTDLRERILALQMSGFSHSDFNSIAQSDALRRLFGLFSQWVSEFRSPVSKLWVSYLDMVCLLLNFIRSSRIGDWKLHLRCIQKMLPWFFAYDRMNYSRYLSLYLCEMQALPKTHPEVHEQFLAGEFSVQRGENSFSQIPVDQTIEQTINRDSKTQGGIIGFSQKAGAVQRWILTAHQRAEMRSISREMAGLTQYERVHKECGGIRVDRDENAVEAVISALSSLIDPFEESNENNMVNITSGAIATDAITADLEGAFKLGHQRFLQFVAERVTSTTVLFSNPLSKLKLKTFSSMSKRKTVRITGRDVIVQADRSLFARMLVVAQSRCFDLRRVLSYELGPVPWAIATVDGNPVKTAKSKLLDIVENGVSPAESVPHDAAWMIDAMAVFHSITAPTATFADLAKLVFDIITAPFQQGSRRVDFVVDRYPAVSIKGRERERRTVLGAVKIKIAGRTQKCPTQWKKFLSVDSNKEDLTKFLAREWSRSEYAEKLYNRTLYVTHGEVCSRYTSDDGLQIIVEDIDVLRSTHEEADTRLLLHTSHAASDGYAAIVIRSPDTDVAILTVSLANRIPSHIYFRTGTKSRTRFIDINAVRANLGNGVSDSLLGFHALTGCDTTSAFRRRGKKAAFDIFRDDQDGILCRGLQRLGQELDVPDDVYAICETFVCRMYGCKTSNSVIDARYHLFSSRAISGENLPPTQDCLRKHIDRANYQALIWQCALEPRPSVPMPMGHGWYLKGESLEVTWMTQSPAPDELLLLVNCHCKTGCNSGR